MVALNVKAETMRLMDRRAALEAEMDAIIAALSAPGGPGITGGLVDAEGFPRSDIDIPAVIAQRRKLGELRNDHKDVTNKIDKNLEVLHSTKLSRNEQSIPRSSGISAPLHNGLSQNDPMEEDLVTRLAFAMIDEITDGSPAAVDGLLLGDEIVKFGNVEAGDRLQERLASEAVSNEDSQVSLVIIRQGSTMNLTVTPRKWDGRGLLGSDGSHATGSGKQSGGDNLYSPPWDSSSAGAERYASVPVLCWLCSILSFVCHFRML